ncbi:MAG: hypothetical protein AB7S38_29040 [Vulcanimicrobiota bacterium]
MTDFFNPVGSGSKDKSLSSVDTLGVSGGYGTRYTYDRTRATRTRTIRAVGFTYSDLAAWKSAMDTPGQTVTITDAAGNSWTGIPLSITDEDIEGTIYLSASVTLRLTT